MRKKESGVITVFLSLILLSVMAFLLILLESARIKGGGVMAKRSFEVAANSLFAEYYAPLFEEYHVFGLDAGYGEKEADYVILENKLMDYMEYTFNTRKNLEDYEYLIPDSYEPYGLRTAEVNITGTVTMLDFKGELFRKQVSDYMKYKVPEDVVSNLLSELKTIKDTKETGEILNKKQKAQEAAAGLESKVLELMEAIDGFAMKKKSIKTENGMAKIQDNFVKKLWIKTVDRNSLGIDNDWLFNSVKSQYTNPLSSVDTGQSEMETLYTLKAREEALTTELSELLSADTTNYTPKENAAYKATVRSKEDAIRNCNEEQKRKIESLNQRGLELKEIASKEISATNKAINLLEEITVRNNNAKNEIEKYQQALENFKEKSDNEQSGGLTGELDTVSPGTEGVHQYDYEEMLHCLKKNKSILVNLLNETSLSLSSDSASWQTYKKELKNYEISIKSLDFNCLRFQYSDCSKPEESSSFFSGINGILKSGLIELIIDDTDKISQNQLDVTGLPSTIMNMPKEKEEKREYEDQTRGIALDNSEDFYEPVFSSLEGEDITENNGLTLLNDILFLQYIEEHFGDYIKGPASGEKVLAYEKEYIIAGNEKDSDNLAGMVNRIVAVRSLTNTITLLMDRKSIEEAGALAAAFVGFTGMPALIEAVKYVVIVTWGFGEGLIDTAAVFSGKNVPYLKQKRDFSLSLTEIFGLTKAKIKEKASSYKEDGGPGNGDYTSYLKIFLLMKNREDKTYHSMDLIQENLRAEYNNGFSIKNCLTGFSAEGEFQMKNKLINLPILTKATDDNGIYTYKYKQEYTY
ncbi:DUF5702 domain-containing protein [Anaerocolumna sp. AGMB13020]|uniref:DUF5702 domain-containing protein n=1 Tax=Anaerocolumna sp. AGMB13020 TaxID=3081750 RepID=UPI002955CA5F|nr:DUF5702 domain-containing protein [Anaerocolumna sp. AGMB13020]WOO34516.1 DUF5702 domain-containing protein [Anaerocolumna sp. AGMB13020]